MVAFSRTCRLCVRPRASAIPILPNCCLRRSKGASATDLLPLRCGLIDFDLQLMRSVRIVFPPRLVLLHIKFNQAILNLRDQGASFACQHADPPRIGCLNSNIRAAEPVPGWRARLASADQPWVGSRGDRRGAAGPPWNKGLFF